MEITIEKIQVFIEKSEQIKKELDSVEDVAEIYSFKTVTDCIRMHQEQLNLAGLLGILGIREFRGIYRVLLEFEGFVELTNVTEPYESSEHDDSFLHYYKATVDGIEFLATNFEIKK